MPVFDLNAAIEQMAAKAANDLREADDADLSANGTMQRASTASGNLACAPVNQLEQTSLKALICWVASRCNMTEAQVAEQLAEKFGVATVAGIDRSDFDQAIVWLVDFKPVIN
jgi:hypothetical protein